MAKTKDQFLRFRIIDRQLRRRSWVKTSTLKAAIEGILMENVDERTIQKDIKAMKEDTRLEFNAPIEYDNARKAYKYTDRNYSILNFSIGEQEIHALQFYASSLKVYSEYGIFKHFTNAIEKIVEGITIKSKLKNKKDSDLIIQTDSIVAPGGTNYLEPIIQAIDEKVEVEFQYKKFGENLAKVRIFHPYMLKEYRNRWYTTGFSVKEEEIRTYALDRIVSLGVTSRAFDRHQEFDPTTYFTNVFGITRANASVEYVKLWFNPSEAHYIRSLSIHPTQKIIKDNRTGLTISIEVIPCYELYEFILGKTPGVKVLSPAHVVQEIKHKLAEAINFYEK